MKKKFLGMVVTFALMCAMPMFANAASAPTVETNHLTQSAKDKGYIDFFANGTEITINARTDGQAGAEIVWDGGSKLVGPRTNVYGGSHDADVDTTNITMNGGTINNLIGGGLHASKVNTANVTVNGGNPTSIQGAGASSANWTTCHRPWYGTDDANAINKVENVNLVINGGSASLVFGGGEGHSYTGNVEMEITDGNFDYVTVGGSNGYTGDAAVLIEGGNIKVFQGSNRGIVNTAATVMTGGTVESFYVGGETGDSSVTADINNHAVVILAGEVGTLAPGTTGAGKTAVNIDQNDMVVVYGAGTVTNDTTNSDAIEISLVSLDKNKITMTVGQKATLNATLDPEEFSDNYLVGWTSSDESIVTVDEAGNLFAKKAGKATITAKLGDKEITCEVTVTKEQPKESTTAKTESKLDDVPKTGTITLSEISVMTVSSIEKLARN